jgi:hypothetical protein
MKSFISQVALASAAIVKSPCPNAYWEPVLDDNGIQVENNGSIVCAPVPEAYKISCSPEGISLDIKYELMYDQILEEQRPQIAESLNTDPARLGNCVNSASQDEISLDYKFELRYDAKDENGNYCYSDVKGGQSNESLDETYINFIYEISPNNAAVTNADGLILSSVLNFSVYCALPETFAVSNSHDVLVPEGLHDGFDGVVAGSDLSAAFVLNKYVNGAVDNDSPAEIGSPASFKVEPVSEIPDFLDYFVTGCDMDGVTDDGESRTWPISQNVNCFYTFLETFHTTPNDITFNMFAFGMSPVALESNRLNCQVRLCFNNDSEGSCYQEFVSVKPTCPAGDQYVAPQIIVAYSDHNTNIDLIDQASEVVEEISEEIADDLTDETDDVIDNLETDDIIADLKTDDVIDNDETDDVTDDVTDLAEELIGEDDVSDDVTLESLIEDANDLAADVGEFVDTETD